MSINGLSNIKSYTSRSYSGTILLTNVSKQKILSLIKEYINKNNNNIYSIILTDSIEFIDNNPQDCVYIHGNILSDKYNDNTIYEMLYNFFEYLCINSKQIEIVWNFNGFETNTLYVIKLK